MFTASGKQQPSWQDRITRADELAATNPSSKEVLDFYARILEFQAELSQSLLSAVSSSDFTPDEFRAALHPGVAAKSLRSLTTLVIDHAPATLATDALRWQAMSPGEGSASVAAWLTERDGRESSLNFFPRVLLEPQAERVAANAAVKPYSTAGNRCLLCGSRPQLAVIRPEGDGGKRSLLCWFCHTEWDFRRVLCPNCGEVNHEKLPRYTAEGMPAVRVEACDACRTYLKSVDLTIDGHAVPLVDEIAAAALDLWAEEHGYQKLVPNIMGF